MTDYTKLVKALRCGEYKPECGASDCPYWSGLGCMDGQLVTDAADAIEALLKDNIMLLELRGDKMPKRGEWVELGYQPNVHETRYRCYLCGRQVLILSGSGELLKTHPYCHCGAKMEVQG